MKQLLFGIGLLSLAVGIVGIFLPLLPTAPFVILAAWCFMRSNQRFHQWVIRHPVFGPLIENWNRDGSIPWGAKAFAVVSLSSSAFLVWWRIPILNVRIAIWIVMMAVALFILTRPTGGSGSRKRNRHDESEASN